MVDDLKKKKLLNNLSRSFNDAEKIYLMEGGGNVSKYYPQIGEHVPYGAGYDMATSSIVNALPSIYETGDDFSSDVLNKSSNAKKDTPLNIKKVFQQEEEDRRRNQMLLNLYKEKGLV